MLIPIFEFFNRINVKSDSEYIYLFTDNSLRTSGKNIIKVGWYTNKYGQNKILKYPTMTQAVIRGLENAYPITTTVDDKRTQWKDYMFDQYKLIIDDEIEQIINILKTEKYKGIKFSASMPFGKGKISNMKETSPKCWNYLNKKLTEIKIDNTGNKPKII
jgi:hypothetical protein